MCVCLSFYRPSTPSLSSSSSSITLLKFNLTNFKVENVRLNCFPNDIMIADTFGGVLLSVLFPSVLHRFLACCLRR